MLKIFQGIDQFSLASNTCLTTGTFDGVHIGHRKIIDDLLEISKKHQLTSVLLTFHPHPRKVLFPDDHGLELLTTLEEKLELFEETGLEAVIVQPFSIEFSRYNSIEYVRDLLINRIKMKHMVIGYDHRFGKNREGDIEQLREMTSLYDFQVTEIPAQDIQEVNVSSTKIRKALKSGQVQTANEYLGYIYSFEGVVVRGANRGKSLGFATANIQVSDDTKLIPSNGVYAVKAMVDGILRNGMMNIGVNPTFENSGTRVIEVHLFEFNEGIYEKPVRVFLQAYLRDERRFESPELLIEQMNRDKQRAHELLD